MTRTRFALSFIEVVMSSTLIMLLVLSTATPVLAVGCTADGVTTCSYDLSGEGLTPVYGTVTVSPITLNGKDQTLTITLPVDITDQDGAGWNIQVAMQPFVSGAHELPTMMSVAITGACDSGSSCSLPNGATPSPGTPVALTPSTLSITAQNGTPAAHLARVISTASNGSGAYYGMGSMTMTATLTATLLAKNTYAGTYSSTILVSVVSGP